MVLRRAALVAVMIATAVAAVPEAAAPVKNVTSSQAADIDSLESMIRLLSIDPVTSLPRSRHTFREAALSEVAGLLAARLEAYTGETAVRQQFDVDWSFDTHDTTFTAENIICRVPASGTPSGVLLVTAHFDATSHRSFPGSWEENWETAPAPGADDNATGVAAVMEAARLLSPLDMPFDIEYVLFGAEELGRLGSIHYVSLCGDPCVDEFIGVINADMIGYSGDGTGAAIMSDFRSGWLADLMTDFAGITDPGLRIQIIKPGPSNWDHASFWDRQPVRLPAITFAEPLMSTGSIVYPDYHTVDDRIGNVDLEQTRRIASLINNFIASFENAPAEVSMLEADLLVMVNGAIRYENVFHMGETVSIRPRVRNTGGEVPPEGASVRLELWLENAGGRKKILTEDFPPADPLRYTWFDVDLGTGKGLSGGNVVTAEITVSGMDDYESDNTASASFVVEGDPGISVLENHYFNPHPIGSRFGDALFCVNTSEEVNLFIEIYSLEGQSLGNGRLGAGYGLPLPTGLSCHRCSSLFGIRELAPGIYLYRLVATGMDNQSSSVRGKFAVEY